MSDPPGGSPQGSLEPRDYHDEKTGAWTQITDTHLVTFARFTGDSNRSLEYALDDILYVHGSTLPGGQVAVFVCLRNAEGGCGFTFVDAELAERFECDLLEALGKGG